MTTTPNHDLRRPALALLAAGLLALATPVTAAPPPVPDRPTGPTDVVVGQTERYCTSAETDPDGDAVQYVFEWGDGSDRFGGWRCQTHTWLVAGTFCVFAYTQDQREPIAGHSPCLYVRVRGTGTGFDRDCEALLDRAGFLEADGIVPIDGSACTATPLQ